MKNDSTAVGIPVNSEYRYSILYISGQYFGTEIFNVKEVIPFPKFTKVPNVHESITGVFSLRGEIYSIIDIRVLLKLKMEPVSDNNLVVILEHDNMTIGVVVDKVMDVVQIDAGKIQIPTRDMSPQYIQYLKGYYEHKKLGVIFLIDIPTLLSAKEIMKYRY